MRPEKAQTPADPIGAAVRQSTVARMGDYEISYMLAAVARVPLAYLAASTRLTADLFAPEELRFVLTWRGVTAAAEAARGMLPADPSVAKELVSLHISKEIASDPGRKFYSHILEEQVLGEGGLVDTMFALPLSAELHASALDLLARFVSERKTVDPIKNALANIPLGHTLKDVTGLLAAIEGHARDVAGLAADPGTDAVVDADDFSPPAPALTTTGQKWLDELLGGGQAAKEAYVILGPTSGGKSCLGVQIAVDGAELQAAMTGDVGAENSGHWYIFTWELDADQMRERVYAYGARISRNSWKDVDPVTRRPNWSSADRPESLKPYELEPFVNSPGNPVMGELERMRAFRHRLAGINSRLHIVDYSGKIASAGAGGVREVVSYLRAEKARGRRVAGVVLDYAGIAVQRDAAYRPEVEYQMLAGFVNQVRTHVSVPMECPAWVLHQLHGDVTAKAPGAKVHHKDARGGRNFADNSDFALAMSTYAKATGLLKVYCTKHRRAEGKEDGVIVKFDGRFGAFRDPDQAYVVDPVTGQIVPRDFVEAGPGAGGFGGGFVDPTAIL